MKTLKITLPLVMALSSTLFAYDDYHHYDNESTETKVLILDQTLVNDVIFDAPTQTLDTQSASIQAIKNDNITVINIPYSMKIQDNLRVNFALPIVSTDDDTGLGDISIGSEYTFGDTSWESGKNTTKIRYKSTTGDDKKALGSGESAFTLTHKMGKQLNNIYLVHGLISYTLNNGNYGNSYTLLGGVQKPCIFNDKIDTNIKLSYFSSAETANLNDETTNIDLMAEFTSDKLVEGIPLGFGLKIPVSSEIGNNNAEKNTLIYFSASKSF